MGLVGYSDSEGSDDDVQTSSVREVSGQNPGSPKQRSQKLLNRTSSNKIKVHLSQSGDTIPNADDHVDEPAPKRVRKAGAFSGFSSLLPAPKNAAKGHGSLNSSDDSKLRGGRGVGLAKGISLKTGAAPAFSRETQPVSFSAAPHDNLMSSEASGDLEISEGSDLTPAPAIKDLSSQGTVTSGKRPSFMPLSVSRKKGAKSKPTGALVSNPQSQRNELNGSTRSEAHATTSATGSSAHPSKSGSLFSTAVEEEYPIASNGKTISYQPLFHQDTGDNQANDFSSTESPHAREQDGRQSTANNDDDLDSLAHSLNLTAAQRRHLFGRDGKGANAQVAQFNLANEYAHNRNVAADQGDAPVHNPVRAVAPGKHSLQQLMNNAISQSEALEEHFAAGKRNKAEAGSRYGW